MYCRIMLFWIKELKKNPVLNNNYYNDWGKKKTSLSVFFLIQWSIIFFSNGKVIKKVFDYTKWNQHLSFFLFTNIFKNLNLKLC